MLPNKNSEQFFLLQVRGDSMIEKGINSGDLVLIRQQPMVDSGEIAAVLVGDEATLKIFRVKETKIYLEPANKKYKPIQLDNSQETRILGKALMAIRFLERGSALRNTAREHLSLSEDSPARGKIPTLFASNSGSSSPRAVVHTAAPIASSKRSPGFASIQTSSMDWSIPTSTTWFRN
jgi:hypothetical protein